MSMPDVSPIDAATLADLKSPAADAIAHKLGILRSDIDEAIKAANAYPSEHMHSLIPLANRIGEILTERQRLLIKAGQATTYEVAAETCSLVMQVERFADGAMIRNLRGELAAKLTKAIADCERSIRSAARSSG